MSSMNRYVVIGSAIALTGAAIWYLSQDRSAIAFDPNVHNKELFKIIVKDLFVQGAQQFASRQTAIKNLKQSGELTYDTLENMKHKHLAEMDEIEQEVYMDYKVNESIIGELMAKYGKDPEISSLFNQL